MTYTEIALQVFHVVRAITEITLALVFLGWIVGSRLRTLQDGPERRWCHRCGEAFFVNRGGEQIR